MPPNQKHASLEITDDQRFALMKMRRAVADCLTLPYHDDRFLLRWLAARNYDPVAAEKMLRASLQWRSSLDVDNILDWQVPQVYKTFFPSSQIGIDKEGAPVYVLSFARVDIVGLVSSATKTEFIKTAVKKETVMDNYEPGGAFDFMRPLHTKFVVHGFLIHLGLWNELVSLKWRASLDADNIVDWPMPEVYKTYFPSGQVGFDKEGAPVYVIPFIGIDMVGLLSSATKTEFLKIALKLLETNLSLARNQAEKHGPAAGKVVGILDMTGFSLKQFAWRPAAEITIQLIQIYEANYPEILKVCYIINVPKVFAFAFSLVKNLLNEYTLSKIQIYKAEPHKWKPVLLENIAPDQLPVIYGGTMTDPDGNPACPSKIRPGGKIPKSFYLKNQIVENDRKDEYKFATVKKGDKLCLDFDVDKAGSFLRWGFLTDGHDIKFGIVKKDKTGKEIPEIPVHRVTCDQNEEEGFLPCETTGTYRVIFDNTYSYLRSKKLHYLIEVTPPLTPETSTTIALPAES